MRKYGFIIFILSVIFILSGCELFVTEVVSFEEDELTASIVNDRDIEVTSDKRVDYIEWTIQGETWGYETDRSGHHASIDVYVFDCVTYGRYRVSIQAYYYRNGRLIAAYDYPLIIYIHI